MSLRIIRKNYSKNYWGQPRTAEQSVSTFTPWKSSNSSSNPCGVEHSHTHNVLFIRSANIATREDMGELVRGNLKRSVIIFWKHDFFHVIHIQGLYSITCTHYMRIIMFDDELWFSKRIVSVNKYRVYQKKTLVHFSYDSIKSIYAIRLKFSAIKVIIF